MPRTAWIDVPTPHIIPCPLSPVHLTLFNVDSTFTTVQGRHKGSQNMTLKYQLIETFFYKLFCCYVAISLRHPALIERTIFKNNFNIFVYISLRTQYLQLILKLMKLHVSALCPGSVPGRYKNENLCCKPTPLGSWDWDKTLVPELKHKFQFEPWISDCIYKQGVLLPRL